MVRFYHTDLINLYVHMSMGSSPMRGTNSKGTWASLKTASFMCVLLARTVLIAARDSAQEWNYLPSVKSVELSHGGQAHLCKARE